MVEQNTSDARAALSDASRATRQVRAASRWFPSYMLLIGILAFAVIVAIEVFFPTGLARLGAGVAWALAMGLLGWWADSHDVYPERAGRRLWIAAGISFGGYLFVLGPIVRWQAGDSLLWWLIAAAVLALPFLFDAWLEWRRS